MYDRAVTLETVEKTLAENIINRNNKLNLFLGMLNSLEAPSIVSLDGAWGSGKTYFVKQIEALGLLPEEQFKGVFDSMANGLTNRNGEQILRFRNKFIPYYFNAWENDCSDNPLQALLFSLLNDVEQGENFRLKCLKNGYKAFSLAGLIKNLSHDFIDDSRISQLTSVQKLAEEFITAKERCKAISDELEKLVDGSDKSLLVIIDELDRCRPSFAIRLLEAIKHCCLSDNVVFLLATNNEQLQHTVQHFYGNGFDGAGYLNKFYDLQFDLGGVDIDSYLSYRLGGDKNVFACEVASELHMTMRELNRYSTMILMVQNYIQYSQFSGNSVQEDFCKYVIVPLSLGLKIKKPSNFQRIYNGDGADIVKDFVSNSGRSMLSSVEYIFRDDKEFAEAIQNQNGNNQEILAELAARAYNKVFSAESPMSIPFRRQLLEVLTLISSSAVVPTRDAAYTT